MADPVNVELQAALEVVLAQLRAMDTTAQVAALNAIRTALHTAGPFAQEPVDLVLWVPNTDVRANDYNPNVVAPKEFQLLVRSIEADGYTQPIVGWPQEQGFEVVDGFHRHRVGKEVGAIRERVHGFLPIVEIQETQAGRNDRIASTIRHNRARGQHRVAAMSDLVVDLARRGWTDVRIAKELGMSADEVLRLKQVTGLASAFADHQFSKAWEPVEVEEADP